MTLLRFTSIKSITCICLFPILLAACGGGGDSAPEPPSTPAASAKNSTITVSPTTVTADGSAVATITVSLKDTAGNPFSGVADVTLQADPCSNCRLQYSVDNGKVTGTISSTSAEDITLSFTVNGTVSPNTATVHFVAGPAVAASSTIDVVAPTSGSASSGNEAGRSGDSATGTADAISPLIATVTLYDANGNRVTTGGATVAISGSIGNVGPVVDNGDGTFTAKVTSIAAGQGTVSFTLNGTASPNTATASYVAPPAAAASDYMAPWTLYTCDKTYSQCGFKGIYVADASDPSTPAVQVVQGWLMEVVPVALRKAYYDPSTGVVRQLGTAALVYAQNNALYRLDLTHAGAPPTRLSTLAPTVVCALYPFSDGSAGRIGQTTWVVVKGFDKSGRTSMDCYYDSPKAWLVLASGGPDDTAIPMGKGADIGRGLGTLVDPANGHTQGLLVKSATDLKLYSANLSQHTTLAQDIFPVGSGVEVINGAAWHVETGLHDELLLDVITFANHARVDTLYWVNAQGATQAATLSVTVAAGYFRTCLLQGQSPADFSPLAAQDSNGTIYVTFPTTSGYKIVALARGALTSHTIYEESSGAYACPNRIYATKGDRLVLLEENSGALRTSTAFRLISISASGAAEQVPTVMAETNNSLYLNVRYYSFKGNSLWVVDSHCDDSSCFNTTDTTTVMRPDGTVRRVFNNAKALADVQQGFMASSGQVLRTSVGILATPSSCSGSWTLYDAETLNPQATPTFGAGICTASFEGFGLNDRFLFLSAIDNAGASVFGLFGNGSGFQLVKLGHYTPPGGLAEAYPLF